MIFRNAGTHPIRIKNQQTGQILYIHPNQLTPDISESVQFFYPNVLVPVQVAPGLYAPRPANTILDINTIEEGLYEPEVDNLHNSLNTNNEEVLLEDTAKKKGRGRPKKV